MKDVGENGYILAFFHVVASITNLSTFFRRQKYTFIL